jgi:hypothetical protein
MVATHEKVSMASVYYRYEHKKSSEKGYGRWVSSALHQQSFHGVFESARRIEDNMLSNGIKIFDRSGSLLFENSLARGKWKKLPRAARIIEVERSRVLSKNEIDDYESTWDKVFDYLIDRQAPQHEIDEARNLYKSFASQIRKEPKKK